ncbi:Monooxygenase FAD-binding [Penicillium coprophilum]|uniref:Monooxygenase FAD-binding n=1 Tax=Penicillium coprophilum TaxID=36646 RepID=UPI00239B508B|nr:Monooxygenase FAD-binding [Penicillium coprophilum]KAJ5177578.1 Monooxygenase FAD-binding [Penicillium coprophilum]
MKVVVVGGGLGGLACAIACRREGIDVEILERSVEVQEVGAGIQIPPNGARIMRDFGLLPQILEQGCQVQQINLRRYKNGRLLRSMPLGDDITEELGAPWIIIHRVDYHRILLDEAVRLGAVLQLGAEVEDIHTDQPAVLLADGRCISADVVIGADGQMSTVRKAVLGSPHSPVPTGDMAYRATFSREQLEALGDEKVNELCQDIAVTGWLGPEKHTVFYPLRGGKEFNLVLMRPDNLSSDSRREQGDIQEMRESYADWDETLQKLVSCVPSVYKWKLTHLSELESWAKESVALLGDACHPTLPYQAQGAAMAVEDGAVIGKLLGLLQAHHLDSKNSGNDPSISTRSSAQYLTAVVLTLYEKCRKARTTRNVQGAIMNRKIFHLPDGLLQTIRDYILGYAGFTRKSDWTWLFSFRQGQTLGLDVIKDCERVFEEWRLTL